MPGILSQLQKTLLAPLPFCHEVITIDILNRYCNANCRELTRSDFQVK